MDRVSVIGTSGSGKTTLARRIAAARGLPMLELDSMYHLPGWQPRDDDSFQSIVAEFVAGDAWVVDGNYSIVRDIVWSRADTVIWLDYSRARTMARVVPRTLRRMITRQELWNGNREEPSSLLSLDPERNILVWSWTTHADRRQRYSDDIAGTAWSHLTIHRLRTPTETEALLVELLIPPGAGS